MQNNKLWAIVTHFYIKQQINHAQLIAQACWRQPKLTGRLVSFGIQPCILSQLNDPCAGEGDIPFSTEGLSEIPRNIRAKTFF